MTTKQCISCDEVQPLSSYYKHKGMADGHLNKCKTCCIKAAVAGRVDRICDVCAKPFKAVAHEIKRGGGITCSRACFYKRLPLILEKKNESMKMSYSAVHFWIKRVAGKPSYCEKCKRSDEDVLYDWSNISGEYKRDRSDWQRLCRKCHVTYDIRHHQKTEKWRESMKAST